MKKILSLLLALILVGSMTVSAFAAEFQVGVSETVIEAGEEVTVTITLDETLVPVETTGFRNIQGQLKYDTAILTYVSHEMGESYKHYGSANIPARSYFTFSYSEQSNATGFADIPAGTVVTIVFKAVEDIEESHLAASLSLELKTNEPGKDAVWYKNAATVVICKEHTWDEGEVTTAPTCTEAGEQVFTCTYEGCGATKTEPVEALGHTSDGETDCTKESVCTVCGETLRDAGEHSYVSEVITEVNCTTDGEVKYTCESCAYSYTETVEALGHTEEVISGKAATCTETGLTDGVKCSACGETLVAQEEIEALGHTEETVSGKAATCTETGMTDGVKCSVCGETLVAQEEIEALGHTEETVPGKAATCTETGLTDGVKCSVCGETLVAQEEIEALGHTEETVPGKAATCTEAGLTDGVKCSVCGETLVEQEEIAALGHTSDGVTDCTKECVCTVCGETLRSAGEHSYEAEVITEVTCTTDGEVKYTCAGCGDSFTETVEAQGHTEVILPGKDVTCEDDGLTEGKKCSGCGEILVAQEEIEALGHTEEVIPGKAATCTEPGLTDGVKCSVCGETLVEQEEIPAGHTEEIIPGKDATCTEPGLTDGVKCSACGEILEEQEEIPAGHTEEIIPGKAATCNETGLTDGVKCSACGEILEEQKEIPVKDHAYEDGVCGNCGAADPDYEKPEEPSVPSTPIKPSKPNWSSIFDKWFGKWWDKDEEKCEHTYTSVVTDPTCTKKGYTTHTCSKCGDSYKDSYVSATGHDYENGKCTDCGAKDPNANKPIKPNWGSIFDKWFGNWWGKK